MRKNWGLFLTTIFIFTLLLSGCSSNKNNLNKTDLTNLYIQSVNNRTDVINGYVDTYKTGTDHVIKPSNKQLNWISSTKGKISKDPSNSQRLKYFDNYLTDLKSETNEYKKDNFNSSITINDQLNNDLTKLKKSLNIDNNKSKALINSENKMSKAQGRLKETKTNQEIKLDEKSKTFIPSAENGVLKITGSAYPNEKITLKSTSDNKLLQAQNEVTTTDSKGKFILTTIYTNTSDEKFWISYKNKNLKDFKVKITIKANNGFKDNQTINTPNTDQPSEDDIDSQSTNHVSKPKATSQDKAALRKAVDYSDTMHLSKQGIYEQLTSDAEGFPAEAAQYAIDNMTGDWNHNALEHAKYYRSDMNMSDTDIYNQLTSSADSFTPDQANYAIQNLGK